MKKYLCQIISFTFIFNSVFATHSLASSVSSQGATPNLRQKSAAEEKFDRLKLQQSEHLMATYSSEVDTYLNEIDELLQQALQKMGSSARENSSNYEELKTAIILQLKDTDQSEKNPLRHVLAVKIPNIMKNLSPQKKYVLYRKILDLDFELSTGVSKFTRSMISVFFITLAAEFAFSKVNVFKPGRPTQTLHRLEDTVHGLLALTFLGSMIAAAVVGVQNLNYQSVFNAELEKYIQTDLNQLAISNDALLTQLTRQKYYPHLVNR